MAINQQCRRYGVGVCRRINVIGQLEGYVARRISINQRKCLGMAKASGWWRVAAALEKHG